jgi:hypothetical protein
MFAGLLISTTNILGPLRYGYHNYESLFSGFREKLPGWKKLPSWTPFGVIVLVFLPWSRVWCFMGAIPIAWQYLRESHREGIEIVNNEVEKICAEATLEAEIAQVEASTAGGFGKQAQNMAAAASRDAHLAQSLRVTDFFDISAQARGVLGHFTSATESALKASEKFLRNVDELRRAARDRKESTTEKNMSDFYLKTIEVVGIAGELKKAAKVAQDRTDHFESAAQRAAEGRNRLQQRATKAATWASSAAEASNAASDAAQTARKASENVRQFAVDAKAAAITGQIKEAKVKVKAAEVKAAEVTIALKTASDKKKDAGDLVKSIYEFEPIAIGVEIAAPDTSDDESGAEE